MHLHNASFARCCKYSNKRRDSLPIPTLTQGAAVCVPTAIGIIGYTIPPGRVKNYSFAFYSGGAPTGQVLGNIMVRMTSEDRKFVAYLIARAVLYQNTPIGKSSSS